MNLIRRQRLAEEFFNECLDILQAKGHDYSQDQDASSNFKKIAHMLDLPVEKVFNFFIACKLARLEELLDKEPENESVEDSLRDLANYSFLRYAYDKEKNGK